jgi:hypothetical protein
MDRMRRPAALASLLLLAPLLLALVVDAEDPDASLRPPPRDPGWTNVGVRGGTTAIYLGNGWVLTAQHVGAGEVAFGGRKYAAVPDSTHRLGNGAPPLPDLILFRVDPRPELPTLRIRPTPPNVGQRTVLIGTGRERGMRIRWNGLSGWNWGPNQAMRWGTNRVTETGVDVSAVDARTRAFAMRFDPGDTPHEAQASLGDSGGAVFVRREGRFELAGVLIAIAGFPGQPRETAIYGNITTAADLSAYREQILALIERR